MDPPGFIAPSADVAFRHVRAAGATFARLTLYWSSIAPKPDARVRPKKLKPTDPADPGYDWGAFDHQLELAVKHQLEPIVVVVGSPNWGRKQYTGGVSRADPVGFGQFAAAAAKRYSGSFQDLPRVRYWQSWNEPNVGGGVFKKSSASWYRDLTNHFAAAVHAVHADNSVIAGGTSPFTTQTAIGPLDFMRQVLCMGHGAAGRPTCGAKISFDIWSHHPYTSGGPTHHARSGDDVSLGDLDKVRALLDAASRYGRIVSHQRIRFWVTEFSWDSNPPDPQGVPEQLEARWVAEGLYRMWKAGVSLVVWYRIRDDPLRVSFYQSGLYYLGPNIAHDRPKPAFRAFRFPFVAFREGDQPISVWGRTPWSEPGKVVVEQEASPHRWKPLGTLTAGVRGVFAGSFRSSLAGPLRARRAGTTDSSYPFSLQVPPDHFYPVFGS